MKLIDQRTEDGSRQFTQLPLSTEWKTVREHAVLLTGVQIVDSDAGSHPTGLRFTFRGHRFVVRGGQQRLDLFVTDPQCSDLILYEVGRHFERLIDSEQKFCEAAD